MICLTSCDPWRKCVLSYFLYWCFSAGERYLHLQLQGSGVCSPSQKNTTAGRASVWRWWAVKRWVWTEMWALEENATTESCKTDRKKKQRDFFFSSRAKLEHVEEEDMAEQIWFRGGSVMWGTSWRNEPLMIPLGIQSDRQQRTRTDAAVLIRRGRSNSQVSCSWRRSVSGHLICFLWPPSTPSASPTPSSGQEIS